MYILEMETKKNKKIMLTHVQHMQAHHATRLPPSFLACGPHSPLPALVVFRLLTRTQGQRNAAGTSAVVPFWLRAATSTPPYPSRE
jgi:hypothetical protein